MRTGSPQRNTAVIYVRCDKLVLTLVLSIISSIGWGLQGMTCEHPSSNNGGWISALYLKSFSKPLSWNRENYPQITLNMQDCGSRCTTNSYLNFQYWSSYSRYHGYVIGDGLACLKGFRAKQSTPKIPPSHACTVGDIKGICEIFYKLKISDMARFIQSVLQMLTLVLIFQYSKRSSSKEKRASIHPPISNSQATIHGKCTQW